MAVAKKKAVKKAVAKKSVSKTKPAVFSTVFTRVWKQKPLKSIPLPTRKKTPLDLTRSHLNPIIEPSPHNPWESKAAFNPSALLHDGKVHIVYRAIGHNDISVLGYAESKDGVSIDKRLSEICFSHATLKNTRQAGMRKIDYSSGGGWSGGSEDPRLTMLDGRVYVTYTAFDGWGSVRIGLSSISLEDFISHRWNWSEPVLISPPGELHKNWVIFPEKIKGKVAILHGLTPNVMIDYVDDMNVFDDGETHIHSIHQDSPSWRLRDRSIRGVGPSPLKTKHGWLIFYHATDPKDPGKYKLHAMLLDLKDPTKILARSMGPVLEPEECYENEGFKSGIVYSCGAIIKDDVLFVYYGGADTVSCVATANVEDFLNELITTKPVKLATKKKKIR